MAKTDRLPIKNNRVHKLLKFMIEDGMRQGDSEVEMFHWTYQQLTKAFWRTNVHEISALCKILNDDEVGVIQSNGSFILWGYGLTFAREAYYSRKYKENSSFWTFPVNLSSILTAVATIFATYLLFATHNQQGQIDKLRADLEASRKQVIQLTRERDSVILILKRNEFELLKSDTVPSK